MGGEKSPDEAYAVASRLQRLASYYDGEDDRIARLAVKILSAENRLKAIRDLWLEEDGAAQ